MLDVMVVAARTDMWLAKQGKRLQVRALCLQGGVKGTGGSALLCLAFVGEKRATRSVVYCHSPSHLSACQVFINAAAGHPSGILSACLSALWLLNPALLLNCCPLFLLLSPSPPPVLCFPSGHRAAPATRAPVPSARHFRLLPRATLPPPHQPAVSRRPGCIGRVCHSTHSPGACPGGWACQGKLGRGGERSQLGQSGAAQGAA